MNKILSIFIITLFQINNSFSQESFSLASREVCNCFDTKMSVAEIKINMKQCLANTFYKHIDKLKVESGISDTLELYNLMVRNIQPMLLGNCEAFKILFNRETQANNQERIISNKKCINYKYGEFHVESDTVKYLIKRNKKAQKEFYPDGHLFNKNKIIWQNDCDYLQIFSKSDKDGFYSKGDTVSYRLINVKDDTLKYSMTLKGMTMNVQMIKAGNNK